MNGDELRIVMHGEGSTDLHALSEVLGACDDLFRAISLEETGREMRLQLTGLGFLCDGCGFESHSLTDWTKQGADDLCPACSLPSQAPVSGQPTKEKES